MISVSNYLQSMQAVDTRKLPPILQDGHQFFLDTEDLYHVDKTVKETLDLYLQKLNEYLMKEKSSVKETRELGTKPPKDLVFVKRFINLNNQTKTKRQIGMYIKSLQKAIVYREIRKSSPFAGHIDQIQKKLIKRYNQLPENGSIRININKEWLAGLKATVDKLSLSIDCLNGFDNTSDPSNIPAKPYKSVLKIFDSMDRIENDSSENTFRLRGDLGEFLGDLERFELAMTVEGDQGGGKTRFAYQLADVFAELGNNVAVFSLEIGKKSDLIRRMREDYLRPENLKTIFITDQLPKGLDTIKEAAKNFGVIILDSWNKVGVASVEFDRLRKANPNTIFIVIFQRTTQKTIRGGTAPLFDAGINIEVVKVDNGFVKNYAITTKNRYGVTGLKYNISDRKLINEFSMDPVEVTPISTQE